MKAYLPTILLAFALSGSAAEPLAGVLACRAVTDSAERLACFDRESAALASAPASPLAVAPTAAPALDPQQAFGLASSAIVANEEAAGARPPKVSKIESRIIGLALTPNGRTLFTLANAQVWRQLESDGDVLARLGDAATISSGLLGSYWLQLKSGRGCKVTRVH